MISTCPPTVHPPPPISHSPGRAAVLRARALADLREHAASLARRGTPPNKLLHDLIYRHALLQRDIGQQLPPVLPLVREVLGRPTWDPLADWSEDVRCGGPALAEGIVSADEEERERRRRACVLADWLRGHAGSLLAEDVVMGAEQIIVNRLEREMERSCP